MSLAVPVLEHVVRAGLPWAAAPSLAAWPTGPASRSAPATPAAAKGDRADDREDQEDEEQRSQEAEEAEAEAKAVGMAVVGHYDGRRARGHHLGCAGGEPGLIRADAECRRAKHDQQHQQETESTPSVHRRSPFMSIG